MGLRNYQSIIFEEIPRRLSKAISVLCQSPARSGKSKIISATALRIIKAGRIPVVITHRDKIWKQLVKHCNGQKIDADTVNIRISEGFCYVAMNQTLIKRAAILDQLRPYGNKIVLIIDEAHRGDFNKTFAELPQAFRIGFSATPAWKWAKHLTKNYASLIHGPQVNELIQSGHITPIEYYEMRTDLSDLVKSKTGEFTEQSQDGIFNKTSLYNGLFDQLEYFQFKKCIVFCASKIAADLLNNQFLDHGYKSAVYYSGMKNGDYALAGFTTLNTTNVLVTVSALSEGFDYSGIDLNILYRATSSLPLFIQMGMRGATPEPGKLVTRVLDFGGNNSRFGGKTNIMALTMDRDWNALWQPPETIQKAATGVAAIKMCPACEFILYSLAKSCSNCGYIYPPAEIALIEGELFQIKHDAEAAAAVVTAMNGRRISTLSPQELAAYAKEKDKKSFCTRIAKSQTQTDPTFIEQYAEAMGYKPGWASRQMEKIDPNEIIDYQNILIK